MGDLYASAVGTTVLINRRVPKRPPTFDGKLLLMDMKGSADETSVLDALTSYGSITSVRGLDAQHGSSSVQLGCSSVVEVTFRTQAEAADVALQAAGTLLDAAGRAICEWHTLLYNDRPYDERGWCCFEQIVANELIKLFVGVPKVDEVLKRLELPPKVLDLAREHDAYAADGSAGEGGVTNGGGRGENHKQEMMQRIEGAKFTGSADKENVKRIYENYVDKLAHALEGTLRMQFSDDDAGAQSGVGGDIQGAASDAAAPILPAAPQAHEWKLHPKQLLLMVPQASSRRGGTVGTTALLSAAQLGADTATFSRLSWYDRCCQVVVPWVPEESDALMTTFSHEVDALRSLGRSGLTAAEGPSRIHNFVDNVQTPQLKARLDELRVKPREDRSHSENAHKQRSAELRNLSQVQDALADFKLLQKQNENSPKYSKLLDEQLVRIGQLLGIEPRPMDEKALIDALYKKADVLEIQKRIPRNPERPITFPLRPADKLKESLDECATGLSTVILEHSKVVERADQALAAAFAREHLESACRSALRAMGTVGLRRYAAGQVLVVHHEDEWVDASVRGDAAEDDANSAEAAWGIHRLELHVRGGTMTAIEKALHPWNHAPRELEREDFEAQLKEHVNELTEQHSYIKDALSGQKLSVNEQLVPIEVSAAFKDADELAGIHDVEGLSAWLYGLYKSRLNGGAAEKPVCALLTAGPAAGKTVRAAAALCSRAALFLACFP